MQARETRDVRQQQKTVAAEEDSFALGWRQECMGRLGETAAARRRLTDCAAAGALEAEK